MTRSTVTAVVRTLARIALLAILFGVVASVCSTAHADGPTVEIGGQRIVCASEPGYPPAPPCQTETFPPSPPPTPGPTITDLPPLAATGTPVEFLVGCVLSGLAAGAVLLAAPRLFRLRPKARRRKREETS